MTVVVPHTPFTATVLGLPRIGPNRELERAVDGYRAGRIGPDRLHETARELRVAHLSVLAAAGLDSIPVGTFSYHDQMLDTAEMFGALPERVRRIADPLDRYFAAARGAEDIAPLATAEWFDTRYRHVVPEIDATTRFALHPEKLLAELSEAVALGVPARPVVVGPLTFLKLAQHASGHALDRLPELLPLYRDLLGRLADAGATWVQIDEPVLVTDLTTREVAALRSTYATLAGAAHRPALLVATYFGHTDNALAALSDMGIDGVALDFTSGTTLEAVASVPALTRKLLVAGVVDGRNVWRTDLDAALRTLVSLLGSAASIAVSSSCSLLHVPYSLSPETALDDRLRSWLAFGAEKVTEVGILAAALTRGTEAVAADLRAAREALRSRLADPRLRDDTVRARLAALTPADLRRAHADDRRAKQSAHLPLPPLPTTTIGSFPRTAAARAGESPRDEYVAHAREEIDAVIAWQERLGLDVLVHGEPERDDVVEYFAGLLDGFAVTEHGWVQSQGARCVRPPILYGDVVRRAPMTTEWIGYARARTAKPVKGMLTGPITLLARSFVRDDRPWAESARQLALALRDEIGDLERDGTDIIQVDEPALREPLPLRAAERPEYLTWSVDAFRLATSGVADTTQIHTHLCCSDFGAVLGIIAGLDADVTSLEAARSRMAILDHLADAGFDFGIGPGVYDIRSPRVPSVEEITAALSAASQAVPAERLWVNPDCGLRTREPAEVEASLRNMVAAAHRLRERGPSPAR